MGFTPIDIENQKFERRFRGYDQAQVQTFLTAMAEEAARLAAERNQLEEAGGTLRRRIEELEQHEKSVQQMLATIKELSDKVKEDARKEGDLIIREARFKADQLLEQARGEVIRIEGQISDLKLDRDTFEDRMRLLIDEHQRLLIQRHHGDEWRDRLILRNRSGEAEQ